MFAPNSRNVFWETYGFNPQKTLVIIDEAHNLPERTADALSFELTSKGWEYIIENALLTEGKMHLYKIGSEILISLKTKRKTAIISYRYLSFLRSFR